MKLRFLTEASGSLTSGYLSKAIHDAGHLCVASDIDENCVGRRLADDFIKMPPSTDRTLWGFVEDILKKKKIDIVIPSLDETLLGWAERQELFHSFGTKVIISPSQTIAIFQDKWLTYNFFKQHGIPTPATSLTKDFPLIKPRQGRGSVGIKITDEAVDMTGLVSQELLAGTEYTVDIFCDRQSNPVYIVPRRRINVRDGKSTAGITEKQQKIISWCHTICKKIKFVGPINIQCFLLPDESVKFLELNPRIAGGMALGFAATENWINLMVGNIINGQVITPGLTKFGLEMRRYYAETFVSRS